MSLRTKYLGKKQSAGREKISESETFSFYKTGHAAYIKRMYVFIGNSTSQHRNRETYIT